MTCTPKLTLVSSNPAPIRGAPSPQNRGFAPLGGRGRGRWSAQATVVPHVDAMRWRAEFARVWQRFCLIRWGNDPHAVAEALSVRVQTARNWLAGLHRPTGDVAALAADRFPEAWAQARRETGFL